MQRLPIVVAAALAACHGADPAMPDAMTVDAATDAPVVAAPLVVVTINLRCLLDGWDARLPLLADGLVAADADVIAMQEVCSLVGGRDALEELLAALAARGATGYAFTRTTTHLAWDMYAEGLAVLTRHPLVDVHVEALPTAGIPRKLLAARIAAPGGDRVVGVSHLDHQDAPTRAMQIDAAVRALDDFAHAPTVLVGDFNETPGGGVATRLGGAGFTDAWAALHANDPGLTFPATGPTIRIDYVWTRGEAVSAASIQRILTTGVAGTYASDHVGLRAVLGP